MDYQTQVFLAALAPLAVMGAIVLPTYLFIWVTDFIDWLIDIQS